MAQLLDRQQLRWILLVAMPLACADPTIGSDGNGDGDYMGGDWSIAGDTFIGDSAVAGDTLTGDPAVEGDTFIGDPTGDPAGDSAAGDSAAGDSAAGDTSSGAGGVCIGFARYCIYLGGSMTQCDNQIGCYWEGDECLGSESSCSDLDSSVDCNNQTGCAWDVPSGTGICTGNSIYCGFLVDSSAECNSQLGCYWDGNDCQGLDESCSAFVSSDGCNSQAGCSWDAS
ncbi:MAG: hypothetical protein A2341_12010 [Deltaproteobacteria bacterium RIFOXYB12_FULL_58_9]|nr:MAG: hypothetical protein A2341_12010 [Deltaproteobacteria bacterium RIFOXYB12_FULL_58_9]